VGLSGSKGRAFSAMPNPPSPGNAASAKIKAVISRTAMAAGNSKSAKSHPATDRVVYSEFGSPDNAAALARGIPDLPPNQQNVRVQASRKGRKGKTVTIVSGFQASPETLADLLKKLKTQCGTGGAVKDDTLEIQGDHTQKLLEILINLGYKAKISGS
jgi:translation initiation factor 1